MSSPSEGDRFKAFAEKTAKETQAPKWLVQAIERIAADAHGVNPIEDDRSNLPEFIYRH